MADSSSAAEQTPNAKPRVILLGSAGESVRPTVQALRPLIEQHAQVVLEDLENAADLASVDADFVMVFGGDGSILRSAQQMGNHQRPVLGINLGKLGFLADLLTDELPRVFPGICTGQYRIIDHLMLGCEVWNDDSVLCQHLSLNEVAVLGGPPYSLLEIDLYVDAEWVTTYSCDGLIVSTPVGSTAHNLSAGGPILRKDLQAVVISPISPHTLTMRPVVDSADHRYEMRVRRRHRLDVEQETAVVVDGVVVHRLQPNDRIKVTRATPVFQLLEVPGHGYYRTLREKLGWGGGIRVAQDNN